MDAYLGSLLLQAAFESDAMREQAQTVLVFETVALVLISVGVTTYATDLFTQILEEGIDASDMMMSLDENEAEKKAKIEKRKSRTRRLFGQLRQRQRPDHRLNPANTQMRRKG